MSKIKFDPVLGTIRQDDSDSGVANEIVVGIGGDYNSIKEACDYAATIANVNNPIQINVYGNYNEQPFAISDYVKVNIIVGSVQALDNSSDFITMGNSTELRGGTIICPTDNTANGVRVIGSNVYIKDIVIINAGNCGVYVINSPRTLIRNTTVSNCGKGICADNSFVIITTSSSATASITSLEILNNCTIILNAFVSLLSTVDIIVDANNNDVSMNACQIDIDKIQVADYNNIRLSFASSKIGDNALENIQEFHVGIPEKGYETCLGEGDSYTRGMNVYTYDGVDYVDVSGIASSNTNSTFTFPNTTNSMIYISSSLLNNSEAIRHYGLKLKLESVIDLGTGNLILEYWDGTVWSDFNFMVSDSSGEYIPRAEQLFEQIQETQLRYFCWLNLYWLKNDPIGLGQDLYWIRIRIENPIITSPTIEQIKLHSNRFEINNDGYTEYFGNGRPSGNLPWAITDAQPANTSPSNQDLYIGGEIGVGRTENRFNSNALDAIGFNGYLPGDLDTGCGIIFRWSYITNNVSGGDIEWKVKWGYTEDGDNVNRSIGGASTNITVQQIIHIQPAPVIADSQTTSEVVLDVSEMVSVRDNGLYGDIIWVQISRDGSADDDTHNGDVIIIQLQSTYRKWNEGLHI